MPRIHGKIKLRRAVQDEQANKRSLCGREKAALPSGRARPWFMSEQQLADERLVDDQRVVFAEERLLRHDRFVFFPSIHICRTKKLETEVLANADKRRRVPRRLGTRIEDHRSHLALPEARKPRPDATAVDVHVPETIQNLLDRRVSMRLEVTQEQVLVQEWRSHAIDGVQILARFERSDAVHLLALRPVTVYLARVHVADPRRYDLAVDDECDHGRDAVRLTTHEGFRAIERVDCDIHVVTLDGTREVQAFFADDADARKRLANHLLVHFLRRSVGRCENIVHISGMSLLRRRRERQALVADNHKSTANSFL